MHQVIVVGAGPVGLWTASELALGGVSVLVLDAAPERDPRSRAIIMSAGTVETLAMRGIADRFVAAGVAMRSSHFGASSTRLDLSVLGVEHPFSLCLPQATTELMLEEYCLELGVEIQHGRTVTGLVQDDETVTLSVQTAHGTEVRLSAGWVVGADGTRSTVREAAGIDFPGRDGTHTGWLADVRLAHAPPGPLARISSTGTVMLQSMGNGYHRIAGIDIATMHLPPEQPPSEAQVREWTRDALGDDFGLHSPMWISRYGNAARLASTFVQGRVIVAGDAAHQFFPAGGQGMNTGLQDALNLAWKLAATVTGHAADGLLDTYTVERRLAAATVISNTDAQLALFSASSPEEMALRDAFAELLAVPHANAMWAERVTGFADPIPTTGANQADPLHGSRLSHLQIDGGYNAILEASSVDRFLLLDIDRSHSAVLTDVAAQRLAQVNLVPGQAVAGHRKWDGVSAVLVRPDGRIAWIGRSGQDPSVLRSALEANLGTWFRRIDAPHALVTP